MVPAVEHDLHIEGVWNSEAEVRSQKLIRDLMGNWSSRLTDQPQDPVG